MRTVKHVFTESLAALSIVSIMISWAPAEESQGLEQITVRYSVVLECEEGMGPDQYIDHTRIGGVGGLSCFAIDPGGVFYLAETGPDNKVRVHKFSPDGQFIEMLTLDFECSGVDAVAVAENGDIVIGFRDHKIGENILARFSPKGDMLGLLGGEGAVTLEDFVALHSGH